MSVLLYRRRIIRVVLGMAFDEAYDQGIPAADVEYYAVAAYDARARVFDGVHVPSLPTQTCGGHTRGFPDLESVQPYSLGGLLGSALASESCL